LVGEISWAKHVVIMSKCKDKTVVEYALKSTTHPIGVASYSLSASLPEGYSGLLPSADEIRERLKGLD
jgi:hypothetical protein